MDERNRCIAMLLAGGQGSRLQILTKQLAKSAVPFGAKYRVIDFTLSNCTNSGIETVGVLTQYQPHVLNKYIGDGGPWGLDRQHGGVQNLPPYQQNHGTDWYKGTANAIYQNLSFIEQYNPEDVLILSGDHIYKMDYSEMLAKHKENDADCTIAALKVSLEDASRFGIMLTDEDMRITGFEEKPKKPKNDLASMGVYMFKWAKLRKYLILDNDDKLSENDFGKNVLPLMLERGERMFAFPFVGYWRDVGTIASLWEGNMDLLDPKTDVFSEKKRFKIYTRNLLCPPHYIGENAKVKNSLIADGSEVDGTIEHSVLMHNVCIEQGALVKNSVIMQNCRVKRDAVVINAIVAEQAVIGEGCIVGEEDSGDHTGDKVAVVGHGVTLLPGSVVSPGSLVD